MEKTDTFSKFIQNGDFSHEKIEEIMDYYNVSEKQLVRKTFKYLGDEIGVIKDNSFFELVITNAVTLLNQLCDGIDFNENEVIINRQRIKKHREALLANANKYNNDVFMHAANLMDEIVLDKNINLNDLKQLLIKLVDRKEDINIIKKLLNTNKGVLLLEKNTLFDYAFNLALHAIKNNSYDIYYYISLLKVFYTSKIDKKSYTEKLNAVSDETNEFANEIYLIIFGVKRGLSPNEILDKYGIIDTFTTPYIVIPNRSYYDEKIITIDGIKTKLRDDGISIRKDGNNYVVGIHIADPTSLIKPDSQEDITARNNYKCIYMPDYSVRMFSKKVEDTLSLNVGSPKNAISMYVVIDNTGEILDYYITENVIRVTANLSYDKSNELFTYHDPNLSGMLKDFYEVASALGDKNTSKNAYWFKKDNSSFDKRLEESKSDKIIAELMVLYNRLIGTIACEENMPYVYRIQDPSYIQSLIDKMEIKLDDSTQKIIDSIYMDSKYCTYPRYHNGLQVPIYTHSSDTLRRYPDMYNLYLLHTFYFKNMNMNFDQQEFENLVSYFNQRNVELDLMESEYERALKLRRVKSKS